MRIFQFLEIRLGLGAIALRALPLGTLLAGPYVKTKNPETGSYSRGHRMSYIRVFCIPSTLWRENKPMKTPSTLGVLREVKTPIMNVVER